MKPSGPAPSSSCSNPDKNSFAVTPDGRILPASEYDPNSWEVLVEVSGDGALAEYVRRALRATFADGVAS